MSNRELYGNGIRGGALVIVDSDYTPTSRLEGAVIQCRALAPITISLTSYAVPGVDFTVCNNQLTDITVTSLVGDQFYDSAGAASAFLTLTPGESVHILYDAQTHSWQSSRAANIAPLTEVVNTARVALNNLVLAANIAGFQTEFSITDPAYPYADQQNINFTITRLSPTTWRMGATGPVYFPADIFTTGEALVIVTFTQRDVQLADLALVSDGIFVIYAGIDRLGVIHYSTQAFSSSRDVAQLGYLIVKRVAGVITFLDELTVPPLRAQPTLCSITNYARVVAPLLTTIRATPNGANLNINAIAGSVISECINWGSATPHENILPARLAASFYRVSAATPVGSTLGSLQTLIDPTQYWNGTSLVTLAGPTNASVQRILITPAGAILVQYGEVQYTNFQDAIDSLQIAPFSQILPRTFVVEIARIAMLRSATALNSNAQAVWISTGIRY